MNKMQTTAILIISLITNHGSALAGNLGKRGATFEIKEEGFVVMMVRKLKAMDLEKENRKMMEIARNRAENPLPVAGILPATENREFLRDPTYTLEEDAVLPCGKVLHKAGTTVNPLDYMDLNRRLFFIDAREKVQVGWLKEQLTEYIPDQKPVLEDRIILVGGSVFKLKKELKSSEIYFDQSGELTTKFGIRTSPAIVAQEGRQLKIREVALNASNFKE